MAAMKTKTNFMQSIRRPLAVTAWLGVAGFAMAGVLGCRNDQSAAPVVTTTQPPPAQPQPAAADYAPRPEYRPVTKFERRGLRLGHGVWDLVFRRRAD